MGGECGVAVPRTQAEQHHVAGHDPGEDTSETEEADRIEATTGHGEQQPTGVLQPVWLGGGRSSGTSSMHPNDCPPRSTER
jgi:hypothetical protein